MPRPPRPGLPDLAAGLLAVIFLVQCYGGARHLSLTWDEPSFISSGYIYLTRGDFRLNPSHPPLMQQLEALPLLALDLTVPDYPGDWLESVNPSAIFGRTLLFGSGNDPQLIARLARLPVMILGALLIVAVYLWGKTLFGPWPALAAAALASFCPNLLAHAKVATEDLGCATFMFVSLWTFWRAMRSRRDLDWGLCGVTTGLALLAKYTSLLLGPVYLAIAGVLLARKQLAWRALPRPAGIVAATALLIVGLGYNGTFAWGTYLGGLTQIYRDLWPEPFHYYLLGSVSSEPRWHFNLVGLAAKTPLPVLLLFAAAVVTAIRRRTVDDSLLFLLLPAALIIAVACFDRANLGLRRILPALPLLLLFTANALTGSMPPWRRVTAWLLLAGSAATAAWSYPHHLSYINPLFGGPERGPEIFEDSNFDWGQDLPALAAWQRAHPEAGPLRLMYSGTADPTAYGVVAEMMTTEEVYAPRPGQTYAVSATILVEFRRRHQLTGEKIDWLAKYQPIDRASPTILIYRF